MRRVLAPLMMTVPLALGPDRAPAAEEPAHYFQVVYDVTAEAAPGYRPAFGYAVFIRYRGRKLLFDTGWEPDILAANLARAGIDPATLDAVAISHAHPDHAGGLSVIRTARPGLAVLAPPGQALDGGPVERVEDRRELGPGLILLRTHTDTPTVGIGDELSLLILTATGPYLITACSHTGVAIVDKAARIARREIFFYTGGARLKMRDEADSRAVAAALTARRVAHVSPGHCSVDHRVAEVMQEAFPTGYVASRLGEKIALTPPAGR